MGHEKEPAPFAFKDHGPSMVEVSSKVPDISYAQVYVIEHPVPYPSGSRSIGLTVDLRGRVGLGPPDRHSTGTDFIMGPSSPCSHPHNLRPNPFFVHTFSSTRLFYALYAFCAVSTTRISEFGLRVLRSRSKCADVHL
jgi:hypothetical protein